MSTVVEFRGWGRGLQCVGHDGAAKHIHDNNTILSTSNNIMLKKIFK